MVTFSHMTSTGTAADIQPGQSDHKVPFYHLIKTGLTMFNYARFNN